ncbi:hypothetical protein Micbo1qcDRAFT_208918 [Microdochium bolleyi]|uniref:Uncharacterized protein n=1 Tax=Microdochium bolleyi TaxID=196109 RepID=A0A136INJ1_9PEZI|nr:hypothetical protein Micbo1qcDRAFT_208918 [Microdochium bolleyi]
MTSRTVILGDLTTTFTPPPQCATAVAACRTCDLGWQAQQCPTGTSIADNVACWPPRTRNVATPTPLMAWGVYSPGIACPAGHTTACTQVGSKSRGDFDFLWPPQPSETAVGCCPIGFQCALPGPNAQTCTRDITTGSVTRGACQGGSLVLQEAQAVPFTFVDANGTTSAITAFGSKAPLIHLVHQASDLPGYVPSTTTSASGSSSRGSEPTAGSLPGSPALPSPTAPASGVSSGEMSAGTAAGIAVGATLGAVAVIGGLITAVCYSRWKKRQARKHEEAQSLQAPPSSHNGAGALSMSAATTYSGHWDQAQFVHPPLLRPTELHSQGTTELHSEASTELHSYSPPIELDSSRR